MISANRWYTLDARISKELNNKWYNLGEHHFLRNVSSSSGCCGGGSSTVRLLNQDDCTRSLIALRTSVRLRRTDSVTTFRFRLPTTLRAALTFIVPSSSILPRLMIVKLRVFTVWPGMERAYCLKLAASGTVEELPAYVCYAKKLFIEKFSGQLFLDQNWSRIDTHMLSFFFSARCWSVLFKSLKAPSFQIGSGWNLAGLFFK